MIKTYFYTCPHCKFEDVPLDAPLRPYHAHCWRDHLTEQADDNPIMRAGILKTIELLKRNRDE